MVMMNMPMKRSREAELDTLTTMANCLMLLSDTTEFESKENHRVFECKTCNRQFPSFQALGGHRASHKKPKLGGDLSLQPVQPQTSPAKPKTHECSICGVEFAIGQALGGHMRRHRAANHENMNIVKPLVSHRPDASPVEPVVKKPNSSRRVWCLDLNLTPTENDLKFEVGKITPAACIF